MKHEYLVVIYLVIMGALIIAVDVLFLREHFWARLVTNIVIVAVFAVVYLVFLRDKFNT